MSLDDIRKIRPRAVVRLIGRDGNAFAIMASCREAARRAGWSREDIEDMLTEMRAGDYDHLLRVAMTYFDVE